MLNTVRYESIYVAPTWSFQPFLDSHDFSFWSLLRPF